MTEQLDSTHSLQNAEINWQADGTPVSRHYDDVYFSRSHGLAESRHVFLDGNRLEQRWRQLEKNAHFIIIETGFGTGLNFLSCWQLWQQIARADCHLHYVSIEKHPLDTGELRQALEQWPELQHQAELLYANYPPALPGIHQLALEAGVTLSLGFGDIIDVLDQICDCDHPQLRGSCSINADAWFLDGFAPAKNPRMWSDAVFQGIAALSRRDTSFATFTAAGVVKRGLQTAGFEVHKVPGFGRKRDMLCGRMSSDGATPGAQSRARSAPWHCGAAPRFERKEALVIGAGLAGCHTARALAESGWTVRLLDGAEQAASAASGNPSGVLYTRLSAGDSDHAAFSLLAYLYAARHYRDAFRRGQLIEGEHGQLNGMLQLGYSETERKAIEQIAARYHRFGEFVRPLTAAQAAELSGIAIEHPALLFPRSGWLKPERICRQLLDHPAIALVTRCHVSQLYADGGGWQLTATDGNRYTAGVCVICCGTDSAHFTPLAELPIRAVGGQITLLPQTGSTTTLSLCHSGYVAPAGDGQLCCGASFRVNDRGVDMREADHRHNLQQLARHIPALLDPSRLPDMAFKQLHGRAALRCTTPDYLPIVGAVPCLDTLRERFAMLAKNAKAPINQTGRFLPGLYVNTGHGSKGLATTPIAAATIATLANHTPRPLPWRLMRALSPARFAIRSLIKGQC